MKKLLSLMTSLLLVLTMLPAGLSAAAENVSGNHTYATAKTITSGGSYTITALSNVSSNNYFKFTTTSAQLLTFAVSAAADANSDCYTNFSLLDATASHNTIGGYSATEYDENFYITAYGETVSDTYNYYLAAGTYYILIANDYSTDGATVTLNYQSAENIDYTTGSASNWSAPAVVTPESPAKAYKLDNGSSTYRYKFTTTKYAKVQTSITADNGAMANQAGVTSSYGVQVLSGADKTQVSGYVNSELLSSYNIDTDSDAKTVRAVYFLCPGTHYIQVDCPYAATGSLLTIALDVTNTSNQDAGDAQTDGNNTYAYAETITTNTTYSGNIAYTGGNAAAAYGYSDRDDYYKIVLPSACAMKLKFTRIDDYNLQNDTTIELFDENSNSVSGSKNLNTYRSNVAVTLDLGTVEAGTYYFVIDSSYGAAMEYTFSFQAIIPISNFTPVLTPAAPTYDGTEQKPTVKITGLTESKDFTVTYKNNINAGTATAVITGKGSYGGTLNANFTIEKATLTGKFATDYSGTYDGKTHKATFSAPANATIQFSEDGVTYTAENPSFTNAGSHKVYYKITQDNYKTYFATAYVKIAAKSIRGFTASQPADAVYSGAAIKPSITLKNGSKALKSGTDYTVTYSANKAVGKATITIKGKGNYTGTITKTFLINPKATSLLLVAGSKAATVKLTKVSGASGYVIYRATSQTGTYSKVKTTGALSFTNTGLTKGKTYYYKAKAYQTVGGVSYYSAFSGVKSVKAK
ncbi:MAG: hypothetical protein QM689_07630 [Oscillospiraceae bacterium]